MCVCQIGIEFPQDDDPKSLASQMETLCEIRIFVPNDEREKELAAKVSCSASLSSRSPLLSLRCGVSLLCCVDESN